MQKRLLESGTTGSDIPYYIYEDTDGSVFAETLSCRYALIAESVDEFFRIPSADLERKIYSAEMRGAR